MKRILRRKRNELYKFPYTIQTEDVAMKCKYCKKEITESDLYSIETPNYIWNFCLDCALEIEDKIFDIIDSRQVTDNQNKVQKPSSDGSQKTADRILNWSTYCQSLNRLGEKKRKTIE
jgi:hypothetical protein